jgi:hypothetical protein
MFEYEKAVLSEVRGLGATLVIKQAFFAREGK